MGNQRGITLWYTGLSGSGKTTCSEEVARQLRARGLKVEQLDGDVVRENLSKGLGFSREDRDTNIRRIGFVCDLLSRNDVIAIASAISPYRSTRDEVRAMHTNGNTFLEVYVDCPVEECEKRDVKGLYAKARAGIIKEFTGVSDPYEPPVNPEITIATHKETLDESVGKVIGYLEQKGLI